ncbi:MAG: xylulokinase [Saccharofermentanales bacterium]|jgi:xylulokinase|nr:hypothetical protein [Clostridiaceae bacterium]
MEQTLLMAVDLGTSFIKAGVYDLNSKCVAESSEPVRDYRPSPGIFIQKGDELFDSVIACIKSVTELVGERSAQVEAIAFTGQMAGFMGVSKDWEDITTWSCSLDSRYMPYADRQMTELKDAFYSISGTNFPQMAPKFAWYTNEFPDQAKKIVKYLMISGYVIGRIGGLAIDEAVMDKSYTSWTGLADVQNGRWSSEICSAVGINRENLPQIVDCNTICGKLSPEYARLTGLKSGIPLVAGAGDKIAGCLGSATVDDGDMVLEASSYGEISCCVPDFRPDIAERRFDILPSAIPGKFFATHFAAGSGITLDWFVNNFARCENQDVGEAFDKLEEKIVNLRPGCNGLTAIGLLGGSSMPSDGDLRGMWMGFDWSHGPEHFYRALVESYTYDFSLAIDRIKALYPEYDTPIVKMIGGGAKSPCWLQMSADIEGKDYVTANRNDVSMWGACILAGNAVGLFKDMRETAKKNIQIEKVYKPNPAMKEIYLKHRNLYRQLLTELRPFYRKIAQVQGD